MGQTRPTVLVLWGKQFDEAVAAIFVTQLRQAGIRVKIVGLHGPQTRGANGLELSSDITLGDAMKLVPDVTYIVIPAAESAFLQMLQDPRVEDLLGNSIEYQVQAIASKLVAKKLKYEEYPQGIQASNLLHYPDKHSLVKFVQELIDRLTD